MDFEKVVRSRFSCKKFSDKTVEKEKLESILALAQLAPTAKNLQEQHIYVIQNPDYLKKIDSLTPCRYNAPVVLVVCYDKNNVFVYPGEKNNSGVEDSSIVATHLLLAACNENLDSCWVNFFNPQEAKKVLNIPENEEILMFLDLGYAEKDFKALPNHFSRKNLSETVTYL